ncbi:class I SAM-dependent methyltransferase [Mycobacterium sp. SMC-2]|uniref:class I SAM-dependent methyltransferase n=1 Tax=Mycobacterium sp. SMC-2 TaxID=2857058 RepID=UPI0021B32BCE|nr:class I SAM-dependent methyltransferase [Mycobacterium sp. SMC-2]UXA06786.1 class I SAM-dependent methyltransferase [Mycobacterium sp. SMC-2]
MADHIEVSLNGTQQTALVTLYGKALDSRRPDSILGDREADRAVRRLDYDFSTLRMRPRDQQSSAVRSKAYDRRVMRFLDDHPDCVVLHLGCGLDTRAYRVNPPPTADWYDVDLPDVIALRRKLFEPRAGLHLVGASVTDPRLVGEIAGDRPVLVVAEGLTPYLQRADGVAMLRRIVGHFPAGELLFDGYSRAGVWLMQHYPPVKASGAQLDWSIDDPRDLERAVPGLVFDGEWWFADAQEIKRHYSPLYWRMMQILFRIRPIRRLGRGLQYHFGSDA